MGPTCRGTGVADCIFIGRYLKDVGEVWWWASSCGRLQLKPRVPSDRGGLLGMRLYDVLQQQNEPHVKRPGLSGEGDEPSQLTGCTYRGAVYTCTVRGLLAGPQLHTACIGNTASGLLHRASRLQATEPRVQHCSVGGALFVISRRCCAVVRCPSLQSPMPSRTPIRAVRAPSPSFLSSLVWSTHTHTLFPGRPSCHRGELAVHRQG